MSTKAGKKVKKTTQPKKVLEPIDGSSEEEQRPKKANGKNVSTKAGKKVKKTTQPKKALKSPEFIESEEGSPKDDKGPSLLGMKEESQSFFDLQKESKNLTIEKKVVLWRDPIKVMTYHMLHYVIPYTSKGC